MSDTEKSQGVTGEVEGVNRRGLKVDGVWYDYDPTFPEAERPGAEVVGREVALTLADSKGGKKFIRSFEIRGEASDDSPPPSAPEPAQDPASPKQIEFLKILAEQAGLADGDLDTLAEVRFKKAFGDLTKREASMTIAFLGGGDKPRRRSPRPGP